MFGKKLLETVSLIGWDCNVCDKITMKNNEKVMLDAVKNALVKSNKEESKLSQTVLDILDLHLTK